MHKEFIETVYRYYDEHGRDMPWRTNTDPYWILVSELMLQQTQVDRVRPKFEAFIKAFPTTQSLADASLGEVLTLWQGLGYNRRAKFLHSASRIIRDEYRGSVPSEEAKLVALPGIGPNTAGAIQAYAFNMPVVFVETNIRAVYIHHFFTNSDHDVDDKELKPLLEQTLDHEHPREWYWALMDYGSHLKKTVGNTARRSKHHTKQSIFQGSDRQVRGAILKQLASGPMTVTSLQSAIPDQRLERISDSLLKEGLIELDKGMFMLPK